MFGIKKEILEAVQEAPMTFLKGIFQVFTAPPKKVVEIWNGLSPEDQELFKQAAISGARLLAKAAIKADKGGKIEF